VKTTHIALVGVAVALAVGASSCTQTRDLQATGTTKAAESSTSEVLPTTMTTAPFAMEPCGGIITNRVVDPKVSLQQFLLTYDQVPTGYTTTGPQVTTGTDFVASVPSTVPVSYIAFELGVPSTADNPTSAPNYSISERIGRVDSAHMAALLTESLMSASEQPQCLGTGRSVPLSGSVANLTAIEASGSSSAGSNAHATVVFSKGPYIVDLTWTSQSSSTSGAPALPSTAEMESLSAVALSHVPG